MLKYYRKETLSTPLLLSNGMRLKFENIGGNTGLLVTENPAIHEELAKAIQRSVGGVSEITEQQATDLKKNPPPSPRRSQAVFGGVPQPPGLRRQPVVPPGGNAAGVKQGIPTFLTPNPGSDSPVTIPNASDFIPPPPPTGNRSGVIKRSLPNVPIPQVSAPAFPRA